MKKLIAAFLLLASSAHAVIIPSTRIIDWSASGVVGGIPARSTIHSTISTAGGNDSTDNRTTIQTAITACTAEQTVYVPPGTYRVVGSLTLKSNITLRGATSPTTGMPWALSSSSVAIGTGAKVFTVEASLGYVAGVVVRVWRRDDPGTYMQGTVTSYSGTSLVLNATESGGSGTHTDWKLSLTVLKSTGTGNGFIAMGNANGVSWVPTSYTTTISSGSTAGSTSFVVASATGISIGTNLIVTETNDSSFVSTQVSQQAATWVDGWNTSGNRARGQIVKVTNVSGTTITFTPALYTAYTLTPWASRFTPTISRAGAESLMIFATNSQNMRNFWLQCADECWIYNVYCDFADGDHVAMDWCYRPEIRQSWFHEAFTHVSGTWDSQVGLRYKTTGALIVDNVLDRMHVAVLAEWGAAGNVIAYNYTFEEYDQGVASGNRWLINSLLGNHGAHPQFNLWEGNSTRKIAWDSYWGTAGPDVVLRNWFSGVGSVRPPYSARGPYGSAVQLNQDIAAMQVWRSQYGISAVGNIYGDSTMTTATYKVTSSQNRNYSAKYLWNIDYLTTADPGTGVPTWGGAYSSAVTLIDEGSYDYVHQAQQWTIPPETIPDSYFLSGKPAWFGNRPYPSFDPANPSAASIDTIPAGYRYLNHVNPPAGGDVTPPSPDPATIDSITVNSDVQITMVATTATDVTSPPVQYAGSCVLDGASPVYGAWQSSATFVFTGLTPSTAYDFQVKSMDNNLNETAASAVGGATTNAAAVVVPGAVLNRTAAAVAIGI